MTTDLQKTPAGAPAGTPPPVGAAAGRALMLVVGFVLIAAGVAGALLLLGDTSVRVEQSATAHPVVDRVVLDLRANGDVEVAVHDADEILVEQRVETAISQSRSVRGSTATTSSWPPRAANAGSPCSSTAAPHRSS